MHVWGVCSLDVARRWRLAMHPNDVGIVTWRPVDRRLDRLAMSPHILTGWHLEMMVQVWMRVPIWWLRRRLIWIC
jgi:hypothetical protein